MTIGSKLLRIALVAVVVTFLILVALRPLLFRQPMSEAMQALRSDAEVSVRTEPWLLFQPTREEPTTGLILYPGGLVDPRAYAPAARAIAAEGYLVAIVPMPLNLAVLAADRAAAVIEAFPGIDLWAIGGHSLGGAMAAQFAKRYPGTVQGLALWAAYPSPNDDLAGSGLRVVSIYASLDGLTSIDEIEVSRHLLPADAEFVGVEGGNHAQFGWYGPQRGDNAAVIAREEQQSQVVGATVGLLQKMAGP